MRRYMSFAIVMTVALLPVVACSGEVATTETVTQTMTVTPPAITTTTTITTTPSPTATITKTYRSWVFGFMFDYPADWNFNELSSTDYPNEPSAWLIYGNHMSAQIGVSKGLTSIDSIVEARLKTAETHKEVDYLIVTQAREYFTYLRTLTREDGSKSYSYGRVHLYQELGSSYNISMDLSCSRELYESNNMKLPQELQVFLGSFSFIE